MLELGTKATRRPPRSPSRRVAAPAGLAMLAILAAGLAPPSAAAPSPDPIDPGAVAERFHAPDAQLRHLIRSLLSDNPRLASALARSRAAHERTAQARALPDPQLSYRYFARTPETRVGPQEQMLELSQGVPWFGKRALEAERTERLAAGAFWDAEDLALTLVAQLKRTYFEAAYLQEALTVNSEERELLRRFESIALRRYATGEGIQQSVLKVQTDLSRLADRETELRERLDLARHRIAELIGRPGEPVTLARIPLRLPELDPGEAEPGGPPAGTHPRLRAVEQRVEADRSWERRRRLETRPDFRFGLGYTRVDEREDAAGVANPPEDNGKDVLAVVVGLSVPLQRKRIRAGVAEARESLRSDEELLDAVRDRLDLEGREAWLRLRSSGERARLYRDVIVPQAEEALASAEAAYTTNRQGFLDLLDAERILFEARLSYHRQVSDHWNALADLERVAGRPVPAEAGPARGDTR